MIGGGGREVWFENRIQLFTTKSFFSINASSNGKIEKNKMGGACGTYGGGERCAQGSGGET